MESGAMQRAVMPVLPERLVRATLDAIGRIAGGQAVGTTLGARVADYVRAGIGSDPVRRHAGRRRYVFRRRRQRRVS